ncbi:MAG TPA: DinB family protein [Terriglobales bacterium]|nr:DinB family protein [Terriglobales bacterium]
MTIASAMFVVVPSNIRRSNPVAVTPEGAMRKRLLLICLLGSLTGFSLAQSGTASKAAAKAAPAQSFLGDVPTSIAASISQTLEFTEGSFLGVVEAMPKDKYDFAPSQGNFTGVRTFGEQVKHVACAQFAFFNEFEGKQPPADCEKGGHSPAQSKAELIRYLKDSFDYSNRVVAGLTAANALDRVEGRYGGPNTRLGISVLAVWHITDHYGQLVEYLRMNGIVPPMTQKYGLKVR